MTQFLPKLSKTKKDKENLLVVLTFESVDETLVFVTIQMKLFCNNFMWYCLFMTIQDLFPSVLNLAVLGVLKVKLPCWAGIFVLFREKRTTGILLFLSFLPPQVYHDSRSRHVCFANRLLTN